MTDVDGTPTGGDPREGAPGQGPVIRDKRRIDPETGEARTPPVAAGHEPGEASGSGSGSGAGSGSAVGGEVGETLPGSSAGDVHPDTALAVERLEEMRRMQAEFVNFRNRTQRERAADRDRAVSSVVEALLPVLDDVHSAREAGDLTEGPFAVIAEKLESTLSRFGVERVGQVGDVFDPHHHDALTMLPAGSPGAELPEGTTETTVVRVVQPGFRIGEQVVRAATVIVADPH